MDKIIIILVALSLGVSCSNKKEGFPLFLALLGAGGSPTSEAAPGVEVPEGATVETVDDTTVVIHIPTTEEETSTEDSTPPSTAVNTDNQDQLGENEFNYQTVTTIPIEIQVNDDDGPVEGAVVTIVDPTDNENPDILFQQVTDETGTASGSITVPTDVETVQANINLGDVIVSTTIPTTGTNPETGAQQDVVQIDRDVTVGGSHNPPAHFTDSDGDGIADANDDYPDDPSRSTLTRFPRSGVNTIAFEDLYPTAGDADLNDYVLFFNTEEDQNAQGKIVGIRGSFEHVARGAGYRHTLNLKLNVPTGATLSTVHFKNRNNKSIQENSDNVVLSASDLANGIPLLEESSKTISTPNNNAAHANNLKFGDVVHFEITFDQPVTRAQLGSAPYDLYAYVVNTNKNIHLPGRYYDNSGKDVFMDSKGFPWAIIVPGKWKWPLESKDIRKADQTGYADFNVWAESKGSLKRTWYTNVTDPSKVFPLPNESNLAGFLAKAAQDNWLVIALGLLITGLSTGYFLTRKNQGHLSN
ncbi:LruC domain-containing protein [Leptospira sp. GIMC2001]|uniref:LruC domain-containing protein n=1 Tax=Leptospira sp. GIMC2001 TaxID=1513297 RepID=UPI00234BC528|nr:LruC domain-containing protein [Leptospira sp. GIMC2001]WCL47532.1 LruC domain-containing protein [Leptospira sp. GIMC2001]